MTPVAGAELGIAAVAVLGVGLLHGASDLALVAPTRRPAFFLAYAAVIGAAWLLWIAQPALALMALLALSIAHFAAEDAPPDRPGERLARGVAMVAAPAALHRPELASLFDALTAQPALAEALAELMAGAGLVAAVALLAIALRRRDGHLAVGVAVLVAPPPLLAFALGFTWLHAWPQTRARMAALGLGWPAYLRLVAPVLAGAWGVVLLTALLLRDAPAPPLATLFAAIAALALPHMLVTPRFVSASAPAPAPHNRRNRAPTSARTSRLPHI